MKFAKELERDLVPEWRLKYLDYKVGKKKLKAIDRALRNVSQTPRLRRRGTNVLPTASEVAPRYSFLNRDNLGRDTNDLPDSEVPRHARAAEEEPLAQGSNGLSRLGTSYGSIVSSPPGRNEGPADKPRAPSSLNLPGAALDPERASLHAVHTNKPLQKPKTTTPPQTGSDSHNAFEVGKTVSPHNKHGSLPARYKSIFSPKRMNSMPGPGSSVQPHPRPLLDRVFSASVQKSMPSPGDVPLEAYRELDYRQAEFFTFLDLELDKIEKFYKEKEEEATQRLTILRDQLHIMRDRRLDELIKRQTTKLKHKAAKKRHAMGTNAEGPTHSSGDESNQKHKLVGDTVSNSWLNPIDAALEAVSAGKYGNSTKAMTQLSTPSALKPMDLIDDRRDFARRPELPDVPYQSAKRKLKAALQEYYRGLELLKAYALLNRTAFRKINKKYDKTVHARPSMRYMTDKVNQASFVNSNVIEGHIRSVEDLYARYFERGNHKVAVGKLRIKMARAGDYTDNTFRNGILLSAGFILGVEGLVRGSSIANTYHPDNPSLSVNTSFLLQIYAGYFLANLLILLFSLACRVWHNNKINYVFIFEYDTRHFLDWRQLAELPCWYFFLLGLFMQLNFHQVGGDSVYIYYPVILIGLSVIILFNPIRIFYYRSRMWLLYSLWRLLLAGLYPVEWRDFYLGDMFCSLTYSMSNIALFSCLYAHGWDNPSQCNSSNSRIMGFLSALPGIWRALQCIRRYWDTGNKFPHLLNCGKYFATIIFYATLSIYRIDKTTTHRAVFITFAIINSIYTSFWDIYYDWSLGDPHAKHPFLRKELGYKKVWWYYTAMVIDPILRFNWVLYSAIHLQLQHSGKVSFFAALGEIIRRGIWSVFRVENEHCTNVGRFRASRDVPLPYELPTTPATETQTPTDERGRRVDEEQPASKRKSKTMPANGLTPTTSSTGADLARDRSSARKRNGFPDDELRPNPLQRAFTHVGDIFRDAHDQDFERKKKPELGRDPRDSKLEDGEESSDDSDTEEISGENSSPASRDDENASEGANECESAMSRIREDLSVGVSISGEGSSQ